VAMLHWPLSTCSIAGKRSYQLIWKLSVSNCSHAPRKGPSAMA
jgi:hypothetical protein